ncbi:hydrogenase expression protein HypE, partial [Pseudomonas sp. FW305-BF8]
MGILDSIPHVHAVPSHRPWPRAVVTEAGWQAAIDRLVEGGLTLLGFWGEPAAVHMAMLDGGSAEIAVVTYE